jgi:hypothetical protein
MAVANAENEVQSSKTAFTQLDADADTGITEIDSVCMNCYETVRKIYLYEAKLFKI